MAVPERRSLTMTQPEYSVSNNNGRKTVNFNNHTYQPFVNFAELLKTIQTEFPDVPPEKLSVKVEGTAWYYGGGSFCITVTET